MKATEKYHCAVYIPCEDINPKIVAPFMDNEQDVTSFAMDIINNDCEVVEKVRAKGLRPPFVMLVDDDGFKNKPTLNPVASYLYGFHIHNQPIVGNIVIAAEICTGSGYYTRFLTREEAEAVNEDLEKIAKTAAGISLRTADRLIKNAQKGGWTDED